MLRHILSFDWKYFLNLKWPLSKLGLDTKFSFLYLLYILALFILSKFFLDVVESKYITYLNIERLDSNIESKSSNNTYLNIIETFKKLFKKINIIESQNLITTLTKAK